MMTESDQEDDILYDLSSSGEDQNLLKNNAGGTNKVSGKAWGRVKNIFTRKSRYPVSIFFILGTEFCERFCYYGLRAILVLYLTGWLSFSRDNATAVFHVTSMLAYFSPLLGAVIADGYIGRFKTILYLSAVYCLGNVVLAFTALPPPEAVGPLIGLLVIALGTGGIKPCVSAFGGDQFHSSQEKERTTFFSVFYFMINMGSILGTVLTPILKDDIACVKDKCYPLAFGVPAILMFVAIVVFVAGNRQYKKIPPAGNLVGKVIKCIWHAVVKSCKKIKSTDKKSHWLDNADDKFEDDFIEDVKILLKVLWLFLPLPVFWALFNQQGSRWTIQAEDMDGSLGKLGRLRPEHMQVLNPVLIIIFIPIFESIIYPLLDCCRIPSRPLQRMVVGMSLSVVAFVVAGFVQMKLDHGHESPLKSGETGISLINTMKCEVSFKSPFYTGLLTPESSGGHFVAQAGKLSISASCPNSQSSVNRTLAFHDGTHYRIVVLTDTPDKMKLIQVLDRRKKSKNGTALLSVVNNLPYSNSSVRIALREEGGQGGKKPPHQTVISVVKDAATNFTSVEPGKYHVYLPSMNESGKWIRQETELTLRVGAVYTLAVTINNETAFKTQEASVMLYTSLSGNVVSMLYLIPQYVIITMGEVLFSVTGLAFAYSQAPTSMKSVVQAAWLLTTAVGDMVVVIVAEIHLLPSQTAEFFLFAVLMAVASIIFAIMTVFYKYLYVTSSQSGSDTDEIGLVGENEKEDIPLTNDKLDKQE